MLNPHIILTILLTLSGCKSYSSKFTCPDAKGLACVMLHRVDQKIENGEIEKIDCSVNSICPRIKK